MSSAVWQWCGESDEFEPFSDSHSATIEAAYQKQGKRALDVKLTIGRHSYRIRHSLKVVGWIRKQFEEPDAVYIQQRVGEASLWRQVLRVGADESESEEEREEEQPQGRQAQDRQQAVRPRREAPSASGSGASASTASASTSAAGEASASAASEGAPGLRPMEVDGRSSTPEPSSAASTGAGPSTGPETSTGPGASTGAGSSTADPSSLEGCLVRSMVRVHGLKGKQAELYNDKRGRCVKYFSTGDNSGRYKVQLVGDDGEPLMRDDGQRQQPGIALWPRNLEVVEATNPSEGAASTGTDVYGEDEDMGDDAAAAAGGAAAASGDGGTEEDEADEEKPPPSPRVPPHDAAGDGEACAGEAGGAGETASGEATEEAANQAGGARAPAEIAGDIAGEIAGQLTDADDSDRTEEGEEGEDGGDGEVGASVQPSPVPPLTAPQPAGQAKAEAEAGAGMEAEVGAATGALKELLQQRPPSVSDDELQFLLQQSPEECLEARLGIADAAEHEADAGERARLVFLARVAELRAGSIMVD